MSEPDYLPDPSVFAGDTDPSGVGDVLLVLGALQRLAEQTRHPVVRACLEQAHDDIVHLTGHGRPSPAADGGPEAA